MIAPTCLLVVAKAPTPGQVKTRLSPPATAAQAARIAAAALLDTLDAVRLAQDVVPVVALAGDLESAMCADELTSALHAVEVIGQRGASLGERLANAHADVARRRPGCAILQIGMDTPQLTPDLLGVAVRRLRTSACGAVLGPASDGGWWALGLRDPLRATALTAVPMSSPDTYRATMTAIGDAEELPELSDVDTIHDALRVAEQITGGRFTETVRSVAPAARRGQGAP